MNYENKPCPGCGAHLHEEDDIVVCPVCATPQHRSCWLENGKCVNESKHAEGYVWAPQPDVTPVIERVPEPEPDEMKVCHICGSENPSGSTHCGQCGAMFGRDETLVHCNFCGFENPQGTVKCQRCGAPLLTGGNVNYNPYAAAMGVDSNERIGEHTAAELALYVRNSALKYLARFRDIENGNKMSFNWAAFFLGPIWFFYRKAYKAGTIFATVYAAVSMIFAGAVEKIMPVIEPYQEKYMNNKMSTEELAAVYSKMVELTKTPMLIGFGLILVVAIVCGFTANRLYYKKILLDLKMFSEEVPDARMQQAFIARRGGVSFMSAICGLFAYQLIQNLLMYIADFISERM